MERVRCFVFSFVSAPDYRRDIDGLRAVAVLAVLLFHLGYVPAGYLGVDVFFVISGYLITGIVVRQVETQRFSIVQFYLRRIRRILPLSVVISHVALWLGVVVMLPDDLENLAQSVVATNVFANNILQAITTRNYWDVVNEYKPLMHTWSLGVEEQFYLVYPMLVAWGARRGAPVLVGLVAGLLALSLGATLFSGANESDKFYWITYRFWELAAGGVLAVFLRDRTLMFPGSISLCLLLVGALVVDLRPWMGIWVLPTTVLLSLGVVGTGHHRGAWSRVVLENPLLVGIGRISFSVYMWHQVLLAYARYCWWADISHLEACVLVAATFVLSGATYVVVEQPFRDPRRIPTGWALAMVAVGLLVSTSGALWVYQRAGVVRDVPELGLEAGHAERGVHSRYNSRNHELDRAWNDAGKLRVLVVGNSFARDFINILQESRFADGLDISYVSRLDEHAMAKERIAEADMIFLATPDNDALAVFGIPAEKAWAVGTKNFGKNNGLYYNYRGDDYALQRTALEPGYAELNERMRERWRDRYIDLIAPIQDQDGRVPVFTANHEFISQDCRHLTRFGAEFYAKVLDSTLARIFAREEPTGPP